MATRFMRVDLSEEARDYRPIALEPGVPMLDKSGANGRIIFRWLGGMVAEPFWEDDMVGYYVRDDQGGRLEDVYCQPASAQDLQGILRDDLAKLRQRLDQSRGETPTERTLRKVLMRSFLDVVDNQGRTDQDSYFFKYKDILGNWRLIWCWGYERLDQEPAPAVVCTDTECNLLFVRRPGKSPKCPACSGTIMTRPKKKIKRKYAALLLALLLLLLLGLFWWRPWQPVLIATPTKFTGPAGTHVDCQVEEKTLFHRKKVTCDAVGVTSDPRIARFNQSTGSIRLMNPGKADIEFQYGGRSAHVTVTATAAANPDKLVISPSTVDLAVGSTARLKVYGEYKDGTKVDLTEATEWTPQNDGLVFAQGNLVEGLKAGSSTIGARYRNSPDSPYVEAAATVNVAKGDFQSIEVAVDPTTVGVGLSGKVRVEAVTGEGKHYNLLESSQLRTELSPSYVAALQGDSLRGKRVGTGKLSAAFGGLTGGTDFAVKLPRTFGVRVHPEKLDMAISEIADIAYVSPDRSPVQFNCSTAGIVDVTPDNRLIGRAEGETQVTLVQSGRTLGTVAVSVTKAEFQGIFFDPGTLSVEVDDMLRPKVFAMVAGSDPPRNAEIAPDQIVTETPPAIKYADFDGKAFELLGIAPTIASDPQNLEVRMGTLKASAPVQVVVAPCQLELVPAGPIDLPLGQMMRLQGFANYSGGRRVHILSERMKWATQEKATPGLELYHDNEIVGAVGATKVGAGPLNVYANYHGQESNRVTFKSVDADPNVKLAIDTDRTLRLAGEGGRLVLTASSPSGDVELIPSLAVFKSANEKVFKFTEKGQSGKFAALSPGHAMVTGSHLAAKTPAMLEFQVCDPTKARLVFDPPSVTVPVNEKAALRLILEADLEEASPGRKPAGKETLRAALVGPNVGYYIAQPNAVRFNPPELTGLAPAAPFQVSGSMFTLRPASAKVEVVDAAAKAVRITPSAASPLAAGQQVSLTVEQQVGDSGDWQEVRPDAVGWTVPNSVIWTPATENLRPTVTLPPDLQGDAKLDATVGGVPASVVFTLKAAGPDATDARLVLDREPGGKYLPVGQTQRYAVMVEKDGHSEPAADVHWPANFENDYVKWEAPVLTAKKENYTQFMRAEVAGRSVLWHTTTYRPNEYIGDQHDPVVEEDKHPDWIKIFSQQGPTEVRSVRFPVGAKFTDFKVEVHYPDGFTRFVMKKALLTTPESAANLPSPSGRGAGGEGSALLTADHGTLVGLRPGKTKVNASFQGANTTVPLEVEVLADVDIDKIAIDPGSATLPPGESHELHVIGYKNGQSIGDITGLGNLTWKSSNPEVARIAGNSVIASNLGEAQVTVERKGLTGTAQVAVSNQIVDELRVVPGAITMPMDSSLHMGSDIQVMRGNLDVSQQANVVPESPGVVEFDPATRTLKAKNVGQVTLGVTVGNQLTHAQVTVGNPVVQVNGKLVVEPGALILAPGQADRLTVYIETADGEKVDRTVSAVYKVVDPTIAGIDDGIARVKALKPGNTTILVTIAGATPVSVPLEVTNEEIKELTADPASLEMAVGSVNGLRIFGRADKSGQKELFVQPDLKATPRKPNVVETEADSVKAKAEGDDTIDVAWRNKLKLEVPVKVTANAITGLQIDPKECTINTNQGKTYEVSAMRGGNRVVLTTADGVQLNVTDPNVADVVSGTTVASKAAGDTKVIATLGAEKAEAVLHVVPGGPDQERRVGPDVIYDEHGGVHHIGDGGGTTVITPSGAVVGLRWKPDLYRTIVGAVPQTAQLHRQYANGGFDDVSNDPNVKITKEPNAAIAKMERVDGGWKITAVAPGTTTMAATLGDQTASMNIIINGDDNVKVAGNLILNPPSISIWSGETQPIASAEIDPGNGQAHIPAKVKITVPENQGGIVAANGDQITGRSPGDATVTVTADNGSSAPLMVHVTNPETITLNPPEVTLEVGKTTPASVMAQSGSGEPVAVQCPIESLDKNVIDADPSVPGQFIAKSQGQTQLHAVYRGKELFAKVSVAGQRFQTVKSSYNRTDKRTTIEVLAASGEGELEYRVYEEGVAPKEDWAKSALEGDARKATLVTDPLADKDEIHLVIEARDKSNNVQKYPLTLVKAVTYEQQNNSSPTPTPK